MARTSYIRWDDDDLPTCPTHIVGIYSDSTPQQQYEGRYVTPT